MFLILAGVYGQIGQPMVPLGHNLFNFGSWMGGDRDGNPYVTAETTRDVVITARLAAVNAFFTAIEQLMFELSIWRCNDEMQVQTLIKLREEHQDYSRDIVRVLVNIPFEFVARVVAKLWPCSKAWQSMAAGEDV